MGEIIRYAGFAREATYAEQPAPAATFHVDIASSDLDAPGDTEIIPPTGIGRSARVHRPGYYAPSGGIVYALDINTISHFLRWVLGGYAFTAGPPKTHEIWGSQDTILESFCARIGKDLFEHVFSGCIADTLEISVEDGYAMATLGVLASKDAKAGLKAIDELLLTDSYPLAFHEVTVSQNASDFSATVKSLTLHIENNGDADAGRSVGSRHPRRVPVNERTTTLDMELFFNDTSQLELYWGGATGPASTGAQDFGMTLHFDAGADGAADIALPRGYYTTVPTQPSGRDEITQSVSVRALQTEHTLADGVTTITSEMLATINNNLDSLAT